MVNGRGYTIEDQISDDLLVMALLSGLIPRGRIGREELAQMRRFQEVYAPSTVAGQRPLGQELYSFADRNLRKLSPGPKSYPTSQEESPNPNV